MTNFIRVTALFSGPTQAKDVGSWMQDELDGCTLASLEGYGSVSIYEDDMEPAGSWTLSVDARMTTSSERNQCASDFDDKFEEVGVQAELTTAKIYKHTCIATQAITDGGCINTTIYTYP